MWRPAVPDHHDQRGEAIDDHNVSRLRPQYQYGDNDDVARIDDYEHYVHIRRDDYDQLVAAVDNEYHVYSAARQLIDNHEHDQHHHDNDPA